MEAVETLIKSGVKVDAKENVHGQTALMFAAALNRDAVVRSLLAHGANANVATSVHKLEHVRFDQDGNIVNLTDFAGKPVVLFFYPKADTPGCTIEACGFRDQFEKLLFDGRDPPRYRLAEPGAA